MSAMGTMMDQIEIPICSSFEPKVLNDQLCYEVDLDRFSNKTNRDKEMKDGFIFLMDYNEDRQKTIQAQAAEEVVEKNMFTQMVKTDFKSILLSLTYSSSHHGYLGGGRRCHGHLHVSLQL